MIRYAILTVATALVAAEAPLISSGGREPVAVGPVPKGLSSTDAESCAECHPAIVREWRQSGHASAWTNSLFQGAYALEPLSQCRNCHAPTNGGQEPAGLAADDGVTCSVCHIRDGHVLGTRGTTAHPTRRDARLRAATFCASCHQFGFFRQVGAEHVEESEPQQDTFGEWSRSSAARQGIGCMDCHMPVVRDGTTSYRSHAFPGGRDLTMLRAAVTPTVSARRAGADVIVEVLLTPAAIGHAFPTGDLFRRVEVRVNADGAEKTLVYSRQFRDVRELGADGTQVQRRREVSDTRVQPPGAGRPPSRRLRFESSSARQVTWSLDYLILPTVSTSTAESDGASRTTVFGGTAEVSR